MHARQFNKLSANVITYMTLDHTCVHGSNSHQSKDGDKARDLGYAVWLASRVLRSQGWDNGGLLQGMDLIARAKGMEWILGIDTKSSERAPTETCHTKQKEL